MLNVLQNLNAPSSVPVSKPCALAPRILLPRLCNISSKHDADAAEDKFRYASHPVPFEYYNSGGSEGARHSCRFIERFVRTVYSKRARLLIAEVKRHECRAPSDNIALTPLRLAWIGCLLSSVWLLP